LADIQNVLVNLELFRHKTRRLTETGVTGRGKPKFRRWLMYVIEGRGGKM
jgi:hypothetical protein